MPKGEYFRYTGSRARAEIQAGRLTVEEYAQSLLSRVQQRDAIVKGWAHLDEDQVLREARKFDRIPQRERGALHGVAIGVKDVIQTKGAISRIIRTSLL